MKKVIIHFPFKIDRNRPSASQIRPIKFIETFKSMGYDVRLVEGYGKERKQQIKAIKSEIASGMKFDFIYSECNTTPTLLTEKHHYPTYPFLDFSFFKFCKKHNIKIGLFYRDIYWCFPEFNKGIIRKVMKLFFRYDLYEYNKYVSALFVPSFEMVSHIPVKLAMPVYELYPGCEQSNEMRSQNETSIINLLYVGGIGCHYDLSMIIDVISQIPSMKLTVCCRSYEWDSVKQEYSQFLGNNIEIVHKNGKDLLQLYSRADIACLFLKPNNYSEFGVPYKLFEAIGFGRPIIASEGTWIAKFVKSKRIGFTCKYDKDSLRMMLEHISFYKEEIKDAKKRVLDLVQDNTWEARCREIESVL